MALLRRIGSFLALAALLFGAPAALVRLGFYDWGRVSLWSTADVRVLLGVLTVVGWAAWAAFTANMRRTRGSRKRARRGMWLSPSGP